MPRTDHDVTGPAVLAASAETGTCKTGIRFSLPLSAMLIYAAIRLLSLGVIEYLLPRGQFRAMHYTLAQVIEAWDANRYLIIAAHGYTYIPGNLRHDSLFAWFPGYSGLIDAIQWIPGVGPVRAAFVITIAAGLVAAWGLARLVVLVTGDSRVALITAALWALAPGTIVLAMLYPEALFCALAAWSLVALVERRWLTAGLLAALSGTVRLSASALAVAIAVAVLPELVQGVRTRAPFADWWRPLVAVILAPLGLLGYWGYAGWAWHKPDAWFFMEHKMNSSWDWGRSAFSLVKHAVMDGATTPVALTIVVVAAAVILTGCVLADRIPWSLKAYVLLVVATAVCTGPDYLGAKPRHLMVALLLGLPLARPLARARLWVSVPLIAALAAISAWFGLYLMSVNWAP
jgi:Mannosyltransferase (PIG-V)